MQRTTLSLASALALCCTLSAPAHAQSNVTLYGLIDAGVERLNNTSAGGGITRMPSIAGSAASR